MKKLLLIMTLFMFVCSQSFAITPSIDNKSTYKNSSYRWTGKPKDKILKWAQAMEDAIDGTSGFDLVYYIPGTAPATTEGFLYYSADLDALVLRTASGWETLEAGGDFASLDEAYNGGAGITVDNGPVTMTAGNSDDNVALAIVQSDSGTTVAMTLTNAGSGNTIDIQGSGGDDIEGTDDTWTVSSAGLAAFVGLTVGAEDIQLENGGEIQNVVDTEIRFMENSEDYIFDFTDDGITMKSGTGVIAINWGDIDAFTGLASLAGDAAADFALSAANSGTFNFTIAQAGTGDNELRLTSAGTATNAIALTTATGGQTFTAATSISGAAAAGIIKWESTGGDLTLDATDSRVIIDGAEAVDNAVTLVSAGGGLDGSFAKSIKFATTESETDSINFDSAGGIDFDISGGAATEDFSVTTDTSITMTATENDAANIVIQENGGTSAGINIWANQGIGASATTEHDASVQLHSDDGGIGLYSNGNVTNAIRIETNGGSGATLHIQAIKGTGASAKGESDASIQLESTVGGIGLLTKLNAADAIRIETVGGTSATINILADEGTAVADGAASIQLLSDDGAIGLKATTVTAATEKASAIQLTALAGAIELYSGLNATNAIKLTADGGINSDIVIFNDQGNTVDSIQLLTDVGGITLTAVKPFKIEAAVALNDISEFTDSDATPDVSGDSFFKTNTTTFTVTDFDGTNIEEGQIIIVISEGAITYDVDGGALICGTTDLVTADGDVTMWIYDGTNWQLVSWMDDAVDQNGRG